MNKLITYFDYNSEITLLFSVVTTLFIGSTVTPKIKHYMFDYNDEIVMARRLLRNHIYE